MPIRSQTVSSEFRHHQGELIRELLKSQRRSPGDPDASVRMYLWRAVDHEGEVLDILVQRRRDTRAALSPMRKLLERDVEPSVTTKVTEGWIAPLLAEELVRSWRTGLVCEARSHNKA